MSAVERKKALEYMFSSIAGIKTELTIRGMKEFTISFVGKNKEAAEKIVKKFENEAKEVQYYYDKECDYTCIFIDTK